MKLTVLVLTVAILAQGVGLYQKGELIREQRDAIVKARASTETCLQIATECVELLRKRGGVKQWYPSDSRGPDTPCGSMVSPSSFAH